MSFMMKYPSLNKDAKAEGSTESTKGAEQHKPNVANQQGNDEITQDSCCITISNKYTHTSSPKTKQNRSRFVDASVLLLDLILRVFDTYSDISVAVEYYLSGDTVWFMTSAIILAISFTILSWMAIKEEKETLEDPEKWRTEPKVWLQGFLGMFSLKPIITVTRILWETKCNPSDSSAFQELRALEQERFAEGLFETMAQLFLQSYVFFVKVERGDAAAISWMSIASVVVSVVCMAKTLLERYPSRARALSVLNMASLYLFILCGVISRCISVIAASFIFPGGFVIIFALEFCFIFFLNASLIDWEDIIGRCSTKVAPDNGQSQNNTQSGGWTALKDAFIQVAKPSFMTVFVFCPLTISHHIDKIQLSAETLHFTALMWVHSILGTVLITTSPTVHSYMLGYIMLGSVCLQVFFLFFHNQIVLKIRRVSVAFCLSLKSDFESLEKDHTAPTSLALHYKFKVPGEVDVNFVHEGESVAMGLAKLEDKLFVSGQVEASEKAQQACKDVLGRGADLVFEDEGGQTFFSCARPTLQHFILQCLLPKGCGVSYSDSGCLTLENPQKWRFVKDHVEHGLSVSTLCHGKVELMSGDSLCLDGAKNTLEPEITSQVLACLEGSHTIKSVTLSHIQLSKEHCHVLGLSVKASCHLNSFKLKHCTFVGVPQSLEHLLSDTARSTTVTEMALVDIGLTNQNAKALFTALQNNKTLQSLDLSHNSINDLDQTCLLLDLLKQLFAFNKVLKHVDFSHNVDVDSPQTIDVIKGLGINCNWEGTRAFPKHTLYETAKDILGKARLGQDVSGELAELSQHEQATKVLKIVPKDGIDFTQQATGALTTAIKREDVAAITCLLECGANAQDGGLHEFFFGLMQKRANEDIVSKVAHLVKAYGNIQFIDSFGRNALLSAVQHGSHSLLAQLFGWGLDCSCCDAAGVNALGLACYQNHTDSIHVMNKGTNFQKALENGLSHTPPMPWYILKPLAHHATKLQVNGLQSLLEPKARDWSLLTGACILTFDHSFEECLGIAVAPQQLPITTPTTSSFVVCVTESHTHTVHMFDGTTGRPISSDGPSAGVALSFGSYGNGPGQFHGPTGIAVSMISSSSGTPSSEVFVSDSNNHRVQVFSAMGVHKRLFGSYGSGPGQLDYPQGLSIDHVRHEVHVCDHSNHRIFVFAESDGRHLFSYGSEGSDLGQLNQPTGVVVDGERGLVAVVDCNNPRVSVFKTSGEFVRCFGHSMVDSCDPKCLFGKGYSKYIALDSQSGHIVVSDSATNRVQVATWEGEWVGGFGPDLPVRGPELSDVRGVAVGPQGQLFLCCRDSDWKWKVMCF